MEPLPSALNELRDIVGIPSVVCSVMMSVLMSISRTPSLGINADDPLDEAAELARDPIIIMKKMTLTKPQTKRPQMTASTHLKNSVFFILSIG